MSGTEKSQITDPGLCMREAEKRVIPLTEANWELVKDDAFDLNILQAAITHLVYLDTERTEFQEKVMEIVFTAYLMGRTTDERRALPDPECFREFIAGLDLSEL